MINVAFATKKPLFIPFLMAGHPSLDQTFEAVMALSGLGAGIIELGVPFSDPVADGPVNQKAAEIALNQGVMLADVLALVARVRDSGNKTPLILFTYLNPILAFGEDAFIAAAKKAGIDGVLIVDLPPEEGQSFYERLNQAGLGYVLLISPTTDPKRFPLYKALNPTFLYYISRLSVTGVQQDLAPDLAKKTQQLRSHFPSTPIVVGFGISTPEQVATVTAFSDGVVVGSALVKTLEEQGLDGFMALAESLYKPLEFF